MNDELTAGVVVKEEMQPPTLEELNERIIGEDSSSYQSNLAKELNDCLTTALQASIWDI